MTPPKAGRAPASAALDVTAVVTLIVLCTAWGLQQVTIKIANEGVQPVLQSGIRSAGATLLVFMWCQMRRVPLFDRDGTLWWGIAAGLLFGIEFLLIYWGLKFTNASRAPIFINTAPFVVAIGSHFFVTGERLTAARVIGMSAAFIGIVIAFADGIFAFTSEAVFGDMLCLIGAVFWGATTVLIKASPLAAARPEKTLLYQLAVSAVLLFAAAPLFGEMAITDTRPLILLSLAYQTVIVAAITYLVWFWLVRHYSAPRLASFTFLTPLLGVVFGALLLSERVTWTLLLALALVGFGIYIVNRPSRG
ncbi:MAG: DMT family transporter [Hyphomicrobiales bacterium]|nr:DMT family transporter [Hyphomicrobiales bacterium]